jgi:hypothetical protein
VSDEKASRADVEQAALNAALVNLKSAAERHNDADSVKKYAEAAETAITIYVDVKRS